MTTTFDIPESLLRPLKNACALVETRQDDIESLDSALGTLTDVLEHEEFEGCDRGFRAMVLSVMAAVSEMRYRISGDLDDLDGQISYLERELDLIEEGSPENLAKQTHLAGRIIDREARTGDALDLSRALSILRGVIRSGSQEFADLLQTKINFSSALRRQYEVLGDTADLDLAIKSLEELCSQVTPSDRQAPVVYAQLGRSLYDRFHLYERMGDLDDAIAALRKAVALTPEGDVRRPMRLSDLGAALGEKFTRGASEDDLDECIVVLQEASRIGEPVQHRAVYLANLANALGRRAALNSDPADLDLSVDTATAALACFFDSASTQRLNILWVLAETLVDRFRLRGKTEDLEEAIDAWEDLQATKRELSVGMSLPEALHLELRWARVLPKVIEAYLELSLVAAPGDKTAIHQRIVEVAESNKAPLLTSFVGRSRLEVPNSVPPELITLERELLDEIRKIDTAELATRGEPRRELASVGDAEALFFDEEYLSHPGWVGAVSAMLLSPEERIERRANAIAELEDLWLRISASSPQGEEYVSLRLAARATWKQISRFAADLRPETTLLLVVVTSRRTLVYIISDESDMVVLEEDLDEIDWQDVSRDLFDEMEQDVPVAREQSWVTRLEGLLEVIRPHLANCKRVLVVPSGAAHLIPWAVAFREAGFRTADGLEIPLTTLPALALLRVLRSRARAISGSARDEDRKGIGEPLVVGNPTGDLDSAESEARQVARLLGVRPLLNERANRAQVIFALNDAPIVHIASHAGMSADPLDSGFQLSDGWLTARDMLILDMNADLIVLSGCETGVGHGRTGAELANLAHAVLASGARSVMVSLWTVDDITTEQLMIAFYQARRDGLDKAEALCRAMESLRAQDDYRDPYFWGGFVLLGDWE